MDRPADPAPGNVAEQALKSYLVDLEESVPFEEWLAGSAASRDAALQSEVRRLYRQYCETRERVRGGADGVGTLPRAFEGFTLLRLLGHGGFGAVYLARDGDGAPVVLKMLDPAQRPGADVLHRFRREVQAISALEHPAILPVLTVDLEAGVPFFTTAFEIGASLDHLLERLAATPAAERTGADVRAALVAAMHATLGDFGPAGPDISVVGDGFDVPYTPCVLRLLLPIARALQEVHRIGLIHRDVKPGNILLGLDGRSWLLDFGLARGAVSASVTRSGALVGTPYYASPEQVAGRRGVIDARTDVHSLGVTLYEVLTGRRPFEGEGSDLYRQILVKSPTDARRFNPALPRDVATVLAKALEKDPDRRYEAGALADDLEAMIQVRPIRARPAGAVTRVRQRMRANPLAAAAFTAAALAGLATMAVPVIQHVRQQRAVASLLAEGNDLIAADDPDGARDRALRVLALAADNEAARSLQAAAVAALARRDEQERRVEAERVAAAAVDQGRAARERVEQARVAIEQLDQELGAERARLRPWYPLSARARELALSERRATTLSGRERAFREGLTHFLSALQLVPGHAAGRHELAAMAFERFREAEAARDRARMEELRPLVEAYIDVDLQREWEGAGTASIETDPPGAEVHLFRFVAEDLRLIPVPFTPGTEREDWAADYLATLSTRGPWVFLRVTAFDGAETATTAPSDLGSFDWPLHDVALQAGDLITQFCGYPPWSLDVVREHLGQHHPPWSQGDRHFCEAQRGGELLFVDLPMPWPGRLEGEVVREPAWPLPRAGTHRLGTTPLRDLSLPMGSYLALVRLPGHADVRYPFEIERLEDETLRIPLVTPEMVGAGFVYVAGGPVRLGGDPGAFESWPLRRVDVPGFFMQRHEVTFAEYQAFLTDVELRDPAAAEAHAPRLPTQRLWERDEQGRVRVRLPAGFDPSFAAVGVSFEDADAYCRWLTATAGDPGVSYDLPTEDEWEKAARGADGRWFTWGNTLDWTLSRSGLSAYVVGLMPGGCYPTDESPYGILDLNGNAREWCAGPPGQHQRILRGCSYGDALVGDAHLANRSQRREPGFTDAATGFRVVKHVAGLER